MENYSAKAIRKKFKQQGVFYTPPALAMYIRNLLPKKVDKVYDPTCGNGSLLSVFDDDTEKFGQELETEQLKCAEERLVNFQGIAGDTLKSPAFLGMKFDFIVANPPFSVKWEPVEDERFSAAPVLPPASKADYAFILHIIHYLSDKGKAVIMEFPGILYRGQREGKIRQWLVENNLIETVIHIPGKKFDDTAIATCIIVINKAKTSTDILFKDEEILKERLVSFDEIKENDFTLSVSTYIQKEVIREEIDLWELETKARKDMVNLVKHNLELSRLISQIDGYEIKPFIADLRKAIDDFEKEALQCK